MPVATLVEIATPAALEAALDTLSTHTHIALDTEFMRESTYFAKLCLVQLGVPDFVALIDPLALENLTPLLKFLADRSRIKILHAARQDIEVLAQAADRVGAPLPAPIFDTQVAAGLLGLPVQIGYGDLVQQRLNHTLLKGHARTDWARRPLKPEQLDYAADDVRYLLPAFDDLYSELKDRGRLDWLQEECAVLDDPSLYRPNPSQAWQRLKGLDRLRPEQRSAAKALARWREEVAVQADKPRGWILPDEALRALSERLPQSAGSLEGIESLTPGIIRRRSEELLKLIEEARNAPDQDPVAEFFKPNQKQLAQVSRLMEEVRAQATRQSIAPELLATRRTVERLVYFGKTDALERGWRAEVIGKRLVEMVTKER